MRQKKIAIINVKVYAVAMYADAEQCVSALAGGSSLLDGKFHKALLVQLVRNVDGKTFWEALDEALVPRIREIATNMATAEDAQGNFMATVAEAAEVAEEAAPALRDLVREAMTARVAALRVPLPSRATYYMLRDFNATHHHAVLAGDTRRYSSTHRVAVVEKDTFEHIKRVCVEAVRALPELKRMAEARRAREKNASAPVDYAAHACLTRKLSDAHREVEFQWLRMFWLQGEEHARAHAPYWRVKIYELTQAWDAMELGLRWALECLRVGKRDAEEAPPVAPRRNYDLALYALTAVAEAREAHFKRASSAAYAKLPATRRPVRRPAFAETSPLPENLRPAIAALAGWKARAERTYERA